MGPIGLAVGVEKPASAKSLSNACMRRSHILKISCDCSTISWHSELVSSLDVDLKRSRKLFFRVSSTSIEEPKNQNESGESHISFSAMFSPQEKLYVSVS